jgi:hypothetical protein
MCVAMCAHVRMHVCMCVPVHEISRGTEVYRTVLWKWVCLYRELLINKNCNKYAG